MLLRHNLLPRLLTLLCPFTLLSSAAAADQGRLIIYANQNPPAACAVLPDSPALGAEHFVKLLQDGTAVDAAAALGSSEICVGALEHGKNYRLILQQGLPLADGTKLDAAISYDLTIPHAKEMLSFKPGTHLPKAKTSFLELSSTNLKAADLYLFALNQRDLSAMDLSLLLQPQLSTYSVIDLINQHASLLEHRQVTLKSIPDRNITTRLDIGNALKNSEGLLLALVKDPTLNLGLPGDDATSAGNLYALHQTTKAFAFKLFNVSDLMVSALRGKELAVSVRSLKSAAALSGADVTLLSRSNAPLGKATTNQDGMVYFAQELLRGTRADTPWALLVMKDRDLTLLPLTGGQIALPEDNVSSETYQPLKLYALTGRGIYRPGESVDITTMVRDASGLASAEPVTLVIRGPQQQELLRTLLQGNTLGTYYTQYQLSTAARRGSCSIQYLQGQEVIKSLSFNVADFVPATLQLQLNPPDRLQLGKENSVKLQANFNYGAAASGLPLSAQAFIRPHAQPLEQFKDYHFGPDSELTAASPLLFTQASAKTTADGSAALSFTLPTLPYAAQVELSASVIDVNQESADIQQSLPTALPPLLIGLKTQPEHMALICKNAAGQDVPTELNYTIYQLQNHYQYVYTDGSWQYRRQELKRPVSTGRLMCSGAGQVALHLPDGRYLFEAASADQGACSSLTFTQGVAGTLEANTPERLELFLDKEHYQPGDSARLSFDSPFAGQGQLIIASDRVLSVKNFALRTGRNQVKFTFDKSYAPGVKALVSLYAPLQERDQLTVRALGLTSVNADNRAHQLQLSVDLPAEVKPGSELTLPVKVNSTAPYYLQAYLVDSGILSLTQYAPMPAFDAIFGPRALTLTLLDSYKQLLRQSDPYSQGYGADGAAFSKALSALNSLPRAVTALALPPQYIDPSTDKAPALKFKLPSFNGSLTLMVSAASQQAIGSVSLPLQLKDKAAVSLSLPRFIRLGDSLEAFVNVHNMQDHADHFALELNCSAPLRCVLDRSLQLKAGERVALPVRITTPNSTTSMLPAQIPLELHVQGSDFNYRDAAQLALLPPYPQTLATQLNYLKAGESATVDFAQDFSAVSVAATTISSLPGVDMKVYAERLRTNEPFGTTQLALQVLALSQSGSMDNAQLQRLVDKLALQQLPDGRWGQNADYADVYATAAAALSLSAMQQAGFALSPAQLQRAFAALDQAGRSGNDASRALSFYARLKHAAVSLSDLYYFAATDEVQSVQALALLSACFNEVGDTAQAEQFLTRALQSYQEYLRLNAQLQALTTPEDDAETAQLREQLRVLAPTPVSSPLFEGYLLLYLHPKLSAATQGQALITALSELNTTTADSPALSMMLLCAGSDEQIQSITHQDLPPYTIHNTGTHPRYALSALLGLTRKAPAASAHGITLHKAYFTLDGRELKLPAKLPLNERIVVRLSGQLKTPLNGAAILRDGLPSGFIADAAAALPDELNAKLCAQRQSYSSLEEFSDSEYVTQLNVWPGAAYCQLYLLRAAFPGSAAAFPAQVYLPNAPTVRALDGAMPQAFSISNDAL